MDSAYQQPILVSFSLLARPGFFGKLRRWWEQRSELLQSLASLAPIGRRRCYKRRVGGVAARDHACIFSDDGNGATLLQRCDRHATGGIRALLPQCDRDATGDATDRSRRCCKGVSVMLPTVAAVVPRLWRRCDELPERTMVPIGHVSNAEAGG
jgi:hypothetical protein